VPSADAVRPCRGVSDSSAERQLAHDLFRYNNARSNGHGTGHRQGESNVFVVHHRGRGSDVGKPRREGKRNRSSKEGAADCSRSTGAALPPCLYLFSFVNPHSRSEKI
jgi:hypothetical protein